MSPSIEFNYQIPIYVILVIGVPLIIAILTCGWKLASWKGGLEEWKRSINTSIKNLEKDITDLRNNIGALVSDISVIKASLEKDSTKNGMVRRMSPLVPTKKAIEILEELSIISEVDVNIPYIQYEIKKRSQLLMYRDIKDPEECFIEISPSIIHELIKKGNSAF